eukprot:jgi/Botrbrau1/273/Bobra.0022s0242.1
MIGNLHRTRTPQDSKRSQSDSRKSHTPSIEPGLHNPARLCPARSFVTWGKSQGADITSIPCTLQGTYVCALHS